MQDADDEAITRKYSEKNFFYGTEKSGAVEERKSEVENVTDTAHTTSLHRRGRDIDDDTLSDDPATTRDIKYTASRL